jgi:hypothetical protein
MPVKIAPRGLESLRGKQYPVANKELTEKQEPVLSTSLDILLQNWPDLKHIISVWPELAEDTKATIKGLIQTHSKGVMYDGMERK